MFIVEDKFEFLHPKLIPWFCNKHNKVANSEFEIVEFKDNI